ncbi:MAG TPA: VWA domain-containing protein [Blastocatellia bacterium]|nr:VWA domain-containing protein [Blastocatellia bacterium]
MLSSSALWWLSLGAIIIFFYLLKLRRKRHLVPSVLLWKRALEELEANAPFRKLRRSLLLLLQLFALAAIVFALARPLVSTSSLAAGSTIIVIDSTASMGARDEAGGSRLDRAKGIAREMIDTLGGDDRAAVVEAASAVAVRSPLTSDRASLRNAIDEVRETEAAGDLADSLRLAEQIARSERASGIVVISDGAGASSSASSSAAAGSASTSLVPIRYVRVGRRSDNVAIVAMNSRFVREAAGELFASIANFSDHPRTITAELRVEGQLVDARTVSLEANQRTAQVFDLAPELAGLAELKLSVDDDLAADNVAYTFLSSARRARVVVASQNPFLLQALAANSEIEPRRLIEGRGDYSDFDCLITEGAIPAGVIESNRPLLAINPQDAAGLWQATEERANLQITSVERSHPVNEYLSYADLHIETATARNVAPWLKPIASAASDPLIWAGENSGRRAVLIGFDLSKSDLPLKVEFPILIANAVTWLASRESSTDERALRTGQPVKLRAAGTAVRVTDPAGESTDVAMKDGEGVFAGTTKAGVYTVKDGAPIAASLLSAAESDTTPRDSIMTSAGEVGGKGETFQSEREAWRWIALLGLAVLSLEWWVYHRRTG